METAKNMRKCTMRLNPHNLETLENLKYKKLKIKITKWHSTSRSNFILACIHLLTVCLIYLMTDNNTHSDMLHTVT